MTNATSSIIRGIKRNVENADTKYNIILFSTPAYEQYNYHLAKTGHTFYLWTDNYDGEWRNTYLPKPDNLIHLPSDQLKINQALDYDFILIHNRMQQFDIARSISLTLHLPIICLHHNDLRLAITGDKNDIVQLNNTKLQELFNRDPNIAVFDTDNIMTSWQKPGSVINPGIDVEFYENIQKEPRYCIIPQMANEQATNSTAKFLSQITSVGILGQSASAYELLKNYSMGDIFINLESYSIDIRVLEAIASKCAVISRPNPMLNQYFEDKKDILYVQSEQHLMETVQYLTSANSHKESLKENAFNIVKERFNMQKFVSQWNTLLQQISPLFYVR